MPSLGWPELLIVFLIVVIVFGAGKLPEIGSSLGRGIREFRDASREESAQETTEAPAEPPARETTPKDVS